MRRLTALTRALGLLLGGAALPALAAPFAYITNSGSSTVTVLDTATNKTVAIIPTQSAPYGVAINADGSRVYVGNNGGNSVTIIDAQLNSVIKHIPVGVYPNQIALKPDGTRLYVANYLNGKMSVIDTTTNTLAATVTLGINPIGMAVNPGGTRVYVSSPNYGVVRAIDTATNNYVGNPVNVQSAAFLAVHPDGTRLCVVGQDTNSLTVIDTATNAIVATVPVGQGPLEAALNPDGSRVYVSNRTDNTISVIDTVTNTVVGTISSGGSTPVGIDFNPAGSRLYAANNASNTVAVLNTANNSLIATVAVGANPSAAGHFVGPAPVPTTTARLSKSASGAQGKDDSTQAAVSADGRYLVFASEASNLVSGDSNGVADVFLRDRVSKQTKRVSLGPGSVQANGPAYNPAISADGRFVAFASDANNLVSGDSNGSTDVFVRDLAAGVTTRVSINSSAVQGNGDSYEPALNADGSKVAFTSLASNLAASDSNGVADVFVRDRTANTTSRVSIATGAGGAQGNGESGQAYLSASGQFVAFISYASNLVAGDSNGAFDVFVRDRTGNTTSRVSIATGAGGAQANADAWQPALSGDGRYVVFASDASNLVPADNNATADVFLRDRTSNTTSRVSVNVGGGQSDGPSYNPVISNDGRYVAFDSLGTLDAADYNNAWDIYLRDRIGNTTTRLSVATNGQEASADSQKPVLSADGRYVLFESFANNLDTGDTNNAWDIFVRDRGVGTTPAYPLVRAPVVTGQ